MSAVSLFYDNVIIAKIPVKWVKKQIEFDPYQRWLKHWEQK